MLYRFQSQAAADVIMMAPYAKEVLAAVGKDGSERGVIVAAALPAAIQSLEAAMKVSRDRAEADDQTELAEQASNNDSQDGREEDDPIPFYVRAQPFLDMLKYSQAEGKDVVWGV